MQVVKRDHRIGAAACAACCAGPILAFLAAIGLGTAAGVALFGTGALVIAAALLDHHIGRILSMLDERNFSEHTVVVFTSDHGEMLGDLGRLQKEVPYEPALRVPLIIAGPGVAAGTCDALTEITDVGATICELAGARLPGDTDGRSFAHFLADLTKGHRVASTAVGPTYRCIRTQAHKYVVNLEEGEPDELYDLAADPAESENLAPRDPTRTALLRRQLASILDGVERRGPRAASGPSRS